MKNAPVSLRRKINAVTIFFMIALALSGITAFPVETELGWLRQHFNLVPDFMEPWLESAYQAVADTNARYPMIAYGFDWLAFAHLMIALAFVGVLRDPVRNEFIVEWAMWCCLFVFPLALICGQIRQIPMFHRIIDCCFGLFGLVPLWFLRKWIGELKTASLGV